MTRQIWWWTLVVVIGIVTAGSVGCCNGGGGNGSEEPIEPPSNSIVVVSPGSGGWQVRDATTGNLRQATFGGTEIHPRFVGSSLWLEGQKGTSWDPADGLKIQLDGGDIVKVSVGFGGVQWEGVPTCSTNCNWDLPTKWNKTVLTVKASGGAFGTDETVGTGAVVEPAP